MKRAGILGALLATVFLMVLLPGMWRDFLSGDANRMDESLRPAQSRTLTLWVLSPEVDDYRLVCKLISACEKSSPGLRIYLRNADASELLTDGAVLPDAVLYAPGDITTPDKCFQPIATDAYQTDENLSAGKHGGIQYGLPLWHAPAVLSLPAEWFEETTSSAGYGGQSYFGSSEPAPISETKNITPDVLPWERLLQPESLYLQPGTAMLQLKLLCPDMYAEPLSAASSLTSPRKETARLWSYPDHLKAAGSEALIAIPLCPAAGDQVRFLSLCRQTPESLLLLEYLLSPEHHPQLEEAGLLAATNAHQPKEPFLQQLRRLYPGTVYFPNAYSHNAEELESYCSDAFRRGQDPAGALLRLR